jgi:hypothetical protein
VLTTSKGQTLSICKDRNKQEALLRHLASSSCCISAGNASNFSSYDALHAVLEDAIRGKPSAHPSVAVAERRHARFVSYPALLIELIALHAFPQAVEWAGGLSLGPSLHKHVSEVVGLQVSHLVSSLAIIRQALLVAGGREANEGARSMQEETIQADKRQAAPESGDGEVLAKKDDVPQLPSAPNVHGDEFIQDAHFSFAEMELESSETYDATAAVAGANETKLPFFGRWSKQQQRRGKHLEKLQLLLSQGHQLTLVEIHKLLAKRIFIHLGKTKEDTFVLLCKGCCSSGQAGLVVGADAVQWAKQLIDSHPESLWHLTPLDMVAMALPSSKRRREALASLTKANAAPTDSARLPPSVHKTDPQHADNNRIRPWWTPQPVSSRDDHEKGASLLPFCTCPG